MKTEDNLAAVKTIPPRRIMFETGQSIPDPGHRFTFFNLLHAVYGRFPLVFDDCQPRLTVLH